MEEGPWIEDQKDQQIEKQQKIQEMKNFSTSRQGKLWGERERERLT
jgi:hypothetical protein